MEYAVKYGLTHQHFQLPEHAEVQVLSPRSLPPLDDPRAVLRAALHTPLGMCPLAQRPCPQSIAIAVPDETRPFPLKSLLPVLLEHIASLWPAFPAQHLTIIVGGGLHCQPDRAQCERILPPEAFAHTVIGHDALHAECVRVGVTSRHTPVDINAAFVQAELKIVLGQIDPHQFVGFTGGAKGVVIGCAGKATIEHNHALMARPEAQAGAVLDNPVRQDLNEAGEMVGIDLAINVVLDANKRVVALLAGNPVAVLMAGYPISAQVYGLGLDKLFDLAIASCGGHPKDICLYQAQKGLNLASRCVREGGKVLLVAACPQGIGDEKYEQYVRQFSTPDQQVQEFARKGFRMGAHKALLFSNTLLRYDVGIVSELDAQSLALCMLTKVGLQECIDAWLRQWAMQSNARPRIAIVPNANTTFFHKNAAATDCSSASDTLHTVTETH
ncbi:MAG: nickel-dependent lactate racemase [Desulfovibrionaceae bacterium]